MSTIQEIATMIEKSKRRFLCIKFRACGLSFSEGIVLLVIGYSRYSNQETISSLSGIDKYQTAKVLAAMEERGIHQKGRLTLRISAKSWFACRKKEKRQLIH
ncbi:MAG: MarR family transcriptional regulator [Enterocloster bolteae]